MEAKPTGLVAEDQRTHIRANAPGAAAVALCEIGVIIRPLPGRFHPGDPLNCVACEKLDADARSA